MESASPRHSSMLRLLHWSIAAILILNYALGTCLGGLRGTAPETWYDLHKGAGFVALGLALMRSAQRLFFEPPIPSLPMPSWQRQWARGSHAAMYALMLAVPVSGYLSSSAAGYPTQFPGGILIPPALPENRDLYVALRSLHGLLNQALLALFVLHLAAVIQHRVVHGHNILTRIL